MAPAEQVAHSVIAGPGGRRMKIPSHCHSGRAPTSTESRGALLSQMVPSAMPTVLRIGPYRFFFFSNEGQEPPHIHVRAGDALAKFWLNPVTFASGRGFSGYELNEIDRLVRTHVATFLEAWHAHFER